MTADTPQPFVTVLVPCRNEAGFIERCLTSVLENGYPLDRLELVVIDGMSDDGTRAILQRMAGPHAALRLIDNPGKTTPKAMNLGIRAAQGDPILRVDAHACLEPGYIRRCVEALEESARRGLRRHGDGAGIRRLDGGGDCVGARASLRGRQFVFSYPCSCTDVGGHGVLRLLSAIGLRASDRF